MKGLGSCTVLQTSASPHCRALVRLVMGSLHWCLCGYRILFYSLGFIRPSGPPQLTRPHPGSLYWSQALSTLFPPSSSYTFLGPYGRITCSPADSTQLTSAFPIGDVGTSACFPRHTSIMGRETRKSKLGHSILASQALQLDQTKTMMTAGRLWLLYLPLPQFCSLLMSLNCLLWWPPLRVQIESVHKLLCP